MASSLGDLLYIDGMVVVANDPRIISNQPMAASAAADDLSSQSLFPAAAPAFSPPFNHHPNFFNPWVPQSASLSSILASPERGPVAYDFSGFANRPLVSNPAASSSAVAPVKDEDSILNTYSKMTKDYIQSFNAKASNSEIVNTLDLSPEQKVLFEKFLDPISLQCMDIPVSLNGTLYDLNTLVKLPHVNGIRTNPLTQEDFYVRDIQPARNINNEIHEAIKASSAAQEGRSIAPEGHECKYSA
ncbi:MAG: hypothetical protein ACHP65_06930 [Legionellales bacterium]